MSATGPRRRANRTENQSKRGPVHGPVAASPQSPPSGSPLRRNIRRLELVCALALTLLIVFLHVYRVSHAGALWRDEVSTLVAATLPSLAEVWASLIYATHPLLPYGVLRIWTGVNWLGSSDTSLRVLGALIGVGAVLALWLNKWLLGYHVPIFSLVLFGLNTTVIQWGDSLRGYGLGSLLIFLVYGLVWKVVESPTPQRVVLAALASILSVQCMYQNAVLLFAICLGGFLVCLRQRRWKRMLVVFGIGAISALSLLPYVSIITRGQSNLLVTLVSLSLSQILSVFATALSSEANFLLWFWFLCGGISILAAGYLITVKRTDRGDGERLDLAIFSLTILVSVAVSFLLFTKRAHLQVTPWHCIVWMGSLALSIDVLLELVNTTIPRRIARLVVALSVAALAVPVLGNQLSIRQTNLDIIASLLQERASPGDYVVVSPWFYGITFQHYYQGKAAWTVAPPIQDLLFYRPDLLKEQMEKEDPLHPVFDAIEKSLHSGNRVWWVGEILAPPEGQLPSSPPPAPNGPGGWYSFYYIYAWTLQLGYFIQSHALDGEMVNLQMNQPVSPYENVPLQVFKGWRP